MYNLCSYLGREQVSRAVECRSNVFHIECRQYSKISVSGQQCNKHDNCYQFSEARKVTQSVATIVNSDDSVMSKECNMIEFYLFSSAVMFYLYPICYKTCRLML